ncbi:MAG: phage major capsid protein [Reinekea sp.]
MKSIQQLREQRQAKAQAMRKLVEDTSEWKDEHQSQYETLEKEISDIDARIERFQNVLDMEAKEKSNLQERADREGISTDEAEHRNEQDADIFNTWIRGGANALSMEQRQLINQRAREVRNTMSTGTGAEGGYLVPNQFAANMLEAMKSFGGMRDVATILRTENGATMDWPTTDATSEEGEIVGENQSATGSDPTFGTKSLNTCKFSSKVVTVPFELLQDSVIDLEGHIRERLTGRLARINNRLFTTGTGTTQPGGIVTASAAGKVGQTGQATSVATGDLLDLIHSVDPAYRGNARFMFHDMTLKELKKLTDPTTKKPLWLPGFDVKEPDTINGYGYTINQHMPEMAASAKSILFGDFSKYLIRDVMQILLFRMTDSKYTEKGQIGFLAWMRAGGDLMDVGGAVKHYQNSAS